jgi:hypothetical protein
MLRSFHSAGLEEFDAGCAHMQRTRPSHNPAVKRRSLSVDSPPEEPVPEVKLTPAQQSELLEALRLHPAPYKPRSLRVAQRLSAFGLFGAPSLPDGPVFCLTHAGLRRATETRTALLIEQVAERLAAAQASNAQRTQQLHGVVHRQVRPGAPPQWPFPTSAHAW